MSETPDTQKETLLLEDINSDKEIITEKSNQLKNVSDYRNNTKAIIVSNNEISDNNERNDEINEEIQTETNDTCMKESSVANSEEINGITDFVQETNFGTQNMPEEGQNLINERKYEVGKNILTVLKCVILLILIHNLLGLILFVIYLSTKYYLYALYTYIGLIISILSIGFIYFTWEKCTNEKANFFHICLYEVIIHNHYRYYKDCKKSCKLLKKSAMNKNIIYRETIRKIEDLRYYTVTTTLIYGCVQIVVQLYILVIEQMYENMITLPLQIIVLIASIMLIMCSIFVFSCKFCDFKNDLGIYRVSIFMYFITLTSIILYISDILSDFAVTGKYFSDSHFVRGIVTLIFIILPGVYNTWHEHYRLKLPFKIKKWRIVTMLLNLNPVFGYHKSIQLQMATRRAEVKDNEKLQVINYSEYIRKNFIVASSRYNECFTESCTQLIIQVSFLLSRINFSELMNEKFAILASGISILNVAVSLVLFFRTKRIKNFEEDPLPLEGMVIQLIGYIPVASRIIALSFLASLHPYLTFLGMFLHWLGILGWILYNSRGYTLPKCLNNAGQAIFYTFTPAINSAEIEIIFQILFLIENIAAILLWNYSKYDRFTTNGILILMFAIVVPSILGCISRYFYRTKYDNWIKEFKNVRDERILIPC